MAVQERQRVGGAGEGDAGAGGEGGGSVEGMARRAGWVSEDEWVAAGNKAEKWAPADKFMERILDTVNPRMQERFRKLDKLVEDSEARAAAQDARATNLEKAVNDGNTILQEFKDYNHRLAIQQYERGKRDAEARMDTAVTEADPEAHKKAKADLEALEASKPKPLPTAEEKAAADAAAKKAADEAAGKTQQQKPGEPHPDMVQWCKDNPWYDPAKAGGDRLTGFAIGVFGELESDPETAKLSLKEKLAIVRKETAEQFPKKFQRRPSAAATADPELGGDGDDGDDDGDGDEGGRGGGGGGGKGRTFADLPASAQKECIKFEKTMVTGRDGKKVPLLTRKKYLEDYDWS